MALTTYKKKRKFSETPEPEGTEKTSADALKFVVQKHHATQLHYDFRLEMEGVLKSWAVPKGPSLNPDDKRLAMMVEDHPYDYKDFEGNIPEGNYGAGNVIVWDNGTYHAVDEPDPKKGEKLLLQGLHKGHIDFILEGEKLKGQFALVEMKGRGKNAWLLIKKHDEYASTKDVLEKNKSVISSATLESWDKKYPRHAADGKKPKSAAKEKVVKKKPGSSA